MHYLGEVGNIVTIYSGQWVQNFIRVGLIL